ncbi:MAG: hypothetical protein GXO27_07170 [Chlorobi bacterium]|nr:hypothetical protein [Chlorobiota bacterium]
MNIFEFREKEKKRKHRRWMLVFYGPFLYAFALLAALKPTQSDRCFFSLLCASPDDSVFLRALILYLYIFIFAILAVYGYKLIEKLAVHKRQFTFFRLIFILLPLVFALIVIWKEPFLERKHYLSVALVTLISLAALAMIEFRKK